MKIQSKKSPALVLSGGGIKAAAFHIGVCLGLREKGFQFAGGNKEQVSKLYQDDEMIFKTYVGSSAGAVISAFLASGYNIDSIIDAFTAGAGLEFANKRRRRDKPTYLRPLGYSDIFSVNIESGFSSRFVNKLFKKKPVMSGGFEVLLKRGFKVSGLFNTHNIEKYFRENTSPENSFQALGVNLYVVATQLNHSRKVIFGPYDETSKDERIKYAGYAKISEAVAASAALPPAFAPYGIKNDLGKTVHFFDGEIRDTLSTHVAADHGADLVIASYSMQPYHYNPEMGSLHEYGIPLIFNQALYQCVQQKIDSSRRHKEQIKDLIKTVEGYLKQSEISAEHREKLLEILHSRTNINTNVDYIYIHPSPQDHKMFFADHFSLNPKILGEIVKTGFRAAINTLKKHNL